MKYRHFTRQYIRGTVLMESLNGAEFFGKFCHIVHKIRVSFQQMQIPSQADPIHALTKKCSADRLPIGFCIGCGVTALTEGGLSTQAYRE